MFAKGKASIEWMQLVVLMKRLCSNNVYLLLCRRKKTDKENVAQAAAGVTDGLLNVSRLLASQVKQSDEAMSHLG